MARFASGKKSKAISDISGFEVRYPQLKTTWDNLRVEPEEYDPKHPQLTPAKNVVDATALFNPRPDNDPENVTINIGFTQDIFSSRISRSQTGIGISSLGSIGFVGISLDEPVTGQVGTTSIGAYAPGFEITGVSATGTVNDVTAEDQIDVSPTGVSGTSTANDAFAGLGITGVSATGGTGTETINSDRVFDVTGISAIGATGDESFDTQTGTLSSVTGTGAIGSSVPNTDIPITGVSGTGTIGTFGEEGNGTLNLTVTPTSATGTANAGVEVAESEIPETNTNGFGENAFGTGVWGGDEEVRGTGGVGDVTIDIFKGPNPQSGVAGTSALGTSVTESEITETGVSATGAIGTSTFFIETAIDVTGLTGTSGAGSVEAKVNPGFGEGAWNDGTWGE
jgi:hypothetical protein